jgi:hypothetical protein
MRLWIHAAALTLAFGSLGATSAIAASPFATIDGAYGELPKNVVPTSYVIDAAPGFGIHRFSPKTFYRAQ